MPSRRYFILTLTRQDIGLNLNYSNLYTIVHSLPGALKTISVMCSCLFFSTNLFGFELGRKQMV